MMIKLVKSDINDDVSLKKIINHDEITPKFS